MKKQHKKILFSLLLITIVFMATGCVSYDKAGHPTGWVYDYFGKPAIQFLDYLAAMFGSSYGIAIIIVTIITRLFMMPSSIKMTKNSMISQARMKVAQPEIDEMKAKIEAATDPQEKARLNTEMMAIYKKYDIDMMSGLSGCLPLLVQMPIISAVYTAIRTSEKIQASTFLGIHLGSKSILLVVLVVLVYGLQGWLMQKSMPETDNAAANQTSKTMMFMNPVMLGYFSWISAAGLGLYFLVGGLFQLGQQVYINNLVRPKIQAMLDEEAKKHPKRTVTVSQTKTASEPKQNKKNRLVPTKEPLQQRNAGKQNRQK
ncbi:membrane protein insertase YidC [Vaginisenegalia massiliensis]|uniref:membrane protein insertase YidC n=1 Tax=Vaginisenegalia massiliensis TaxID=2058294 RepID=UPI000F52B827|nr:membrane protein insertase YidC [Vaginisenegalia massiliensis]